jgi:hypothetical protein
VGMACRAKEPLTLPAAHKWGSPGARNEAMEPHLQGRCPRIRPRHRGEHRPGPSQRKASHGTETRQASRPALTRASGASEVTRPAR